LSSLNDLKVPLFICTVNETTSEVLFASLVIESTVIPPVFVAVTVTNEGDALACCTVYVVKTLLTSRMMRIIDFNNTLLIN